MGSMTMTIHVRPPLKPLYCWLKTGFKIEMPVVNVRYNTVYNLKKFYIFLRPKILSRICEKKFFLFF